MSAPQWPTGPVLEYAPQPVPPGPVWSARRKVAFRLLFVIGGGILLLSIFANLGLALVWKYSGVFWVLAQIGSYLTRGEGVEVYISSTGDVLWQWCMHLGWVVVGLVIVAVWTALDRRRPHYRSLAGLLTVFARVGLALSMLYYGLVKVIPTQMGFTTLPTYQLQLVGDTSMFSLLWGFMGASTPYSVVTGLVEVAAGVLLLWKRTTVLGLLVGLVATVQVFLLNMFYDVPVKIVAGELVVIAIALLIPYLPNLLRVALGRRDLREVDIPLAAGAQRDWLRVIGVIAKFGVAALLTVLGISQGVLVTWTTSTVRSPLDGQWRATSFTIDGAPASLTERSPTPWANLAITMRGSDSNPVLKTLSESYDSVTTQDPAGYTTAWKADVDGDVLNLRKRKDDPPLPVTTRLDGDTLHIDAVLDGKQIEGTYERRFMERDRSHFRFVAPRPEGS